MLTFHSGTTGTSGTDFSIIPTRAYMRVHMRINLLKQPISLFINRVPVVPYVIILSDVFIRKKPANHFVIVC